VPACLPGGYQPIALGYSACDLLCPKLPNTFIKEFSDRALSFNFSGHLPLLCACFAGKVETNAVPCHRLICPPVACCLCAPAFSKVGGPAVVHLSRLSSHLKTLGPLGQTAETGLCEMASRSAAAEARRRRILERGSDRLNRITVGTNAGETMLPVTVCCLKLLVLLSFSFWNGDAAGPAAQDKQPDTSAAYLNVSLPSTDEHTDVPKRLHAPERPHSEAAQEHTSDSWHVQSGAAEIHTADETERDRTLGEGRGLKQDSSLKPGQRALPGRSDKWAQYESSSAKQPPRQPQTKLKALTPIQVGHFLPYGSS